MIRESLVDLSFQQMSQISFYVSTFLQFIINTGDVFELLELTHNYWSVASLSIITCWRFYDDALYKY